MSYICYVLLMGIVTVCVDICTCHKSYMYVWVCLYACIIHVCEKYTYIHTRICKYMSITRCVYIVECSKLQLYNLCICVIGCIIIIGKSSWLYLWFCIHECSWTENSNLLLIVCQALV